VTSFDQITGMEIRF